MTSLKRFLICGFDSITDAFDADVPPATAAVGSLAMSCICLILDLLALPTPEIQDQPKVGVIVVAGEIHHETTKDFFLTIQAQDWGEPPLSNHATVNITVADLNDNSPVFSRPSYSALINESAEIGDTVAAVTATDVDSGENGRILSSIAGGDWRQARAVCHRPSRCHRRQRTPRSRDDLQLRS